MDGPDPGQTETAPRRRAAPGESQTQVQDLPRPTIATVAATAGVSITTATRVLSGRGYASASTRSRVLAAVEDIGYVPSAVARGLRKGRTDTIGLLMADVENPFFSAVARNVEQVMTRAGYSVVLLNSDDDAAKECRLLDLVDTLRIAGLIVSPAGTNRERFERMRRHGIAIVQIGRLVPHFETDNVRVDNSTGAYDAVSALIRAGHRRIGLMVGSTKASPGRERLEGYVRALGEHGIAVDSSLIHGRSFQRDHAVEEARILLEVRPRVTAIFASNSILAEACILALKEAGLSVPADISLVAYDDVLWMRMVDCGITTMRLPVEKMAQTAAEMLLRRLDDKSARAPATVLYRPELIVRDSIAPPSFVDSDPTLEGSGATST